MRFLLPALAIIGGLTAVHTADAQTLVFSDAVVIDASAAVPTRVATVVVQDGKIAAVGEAPRVPEGARRVDARGRYLLPGLWDMHAHLAALTDIGRAPERYVAHGVLGLRDMGGFIEQLLPLRAALRAGTRVGPELVVAGPTLNSEQAAPFHRKLTTAAEARAAVRELKAAGVDFIKIHRATTRKVFDALVDETRRQGLRLSGHVPLVMSWTDAATAGMHTIEHIQTNFENLQPDPAKMASEFQGIASRLDGPEGDRIFDVMKRHGTYFTPTLIGYEASIEKAAPALAERRRVAYERMKRISARIVASGVAIVTGTDVLDRHGEMLLRELERLVEVGVTPADVLRAATLTSATAAGRPELGRLSVGAPASFLVLERNPLENIGNLRSLTAVVLRGKLIEAEELAALRR